MFYVMLSGGETDALLIINDFLTSYVTGTKCQNVNQLQVQITGATYVLRALTSWTYA